MDVLLVKSFLSANKKCLQLKYRADIWSWFLTEECPMTPQCKWYWSYTLERNHCFESKSYWLKKKKRPNHLNSYIFKTVTCLCLKNPSVSSQANINLPFQGTPISNFPPPLAHQGSDSWSPTFPLWLIADLPISWVETQKCRCPSYLTDLKDPRTSHSQTSF